MPRKQFDENKIRFGTGAAGGAIAYRPNEVLVATGAPDADDPVHTRRLVNRALDVDSGDHQEFRQLRDSVRKLLELVRRMSRGDGSKERAAQLDELEAAVTGGARDVPTGGRPRLESDRRLNDRWSVFVPADDADIDPIRISRRLLAAGINAQPNYVRFIDTLQPAPNYIAPNYIAPNYIAPNYIAPNYIAPNYIAPNLGSAPGGACHCEPCPGAPQRGREVPMTTARAAYGPMPGPPSTRLPAELSTEIHVLDVRFQAPERDFTQEIVDLEAARANGDLAAIDGAVSDAFAEKVFLQQSGGAPVTTGPSRALLPLQLRLLETAKAGSDAAFGRALAEFLVEPTSEGGGANVNDDRFIDPTTNHAEFIQGIIDRVVTSDTGTSVVRHHAVAGTLGEVSDEELARSIDRVVEQHSNADELRIMNLSLSGYTDDDQPAPVLSESIAAAQANGWLIVASAGNQGSCRLAWPAALEGVVSVAAYGPCGPAAFSNHGPWVDACGPGVGVVSTFTGPVDGSLTIVEEPEHLTVGTEFVASSDGEMYASWDGTSFSAPYVAAMLAARAAKATGSISERVEAAIAAMITDPDLIRFPGYGTIVSSESVKVSQQITRESNLR